MPFIRASAGSPHGTLFLLARNLAFLMHNLRNNSQQMVKKFARDVWDSLAHLVSNTGKRQKEADGRGSTVGRERALVSGLLRRVSHPGLLHLALSLLASLHNAARDDPATDLVSLHLGVWPTGLASNSGLQERLVEGLLSGVLARALASLPLDPALLRLHADTQFAAGRHGGALRLYLEAAAVRTDYFQQECGPPGWLLEEAVVGRLVTCCRELGRLMQAVVLSQFSLEPNYAQVAAECTVLVQTCHLQTFKFLEDQTEDGADSLYGCVWDMAILEFAMSLHTKRGEVGGPQRVYFL
jgi:hypothetical protein